MTEQQGPYFIERGQGNTVAVRSSIAYSAALMAPFELRKVSPRKNGKDNIVGPMRLERGEKLVLSCVGHDDVVIEGRSEGE